MRRYEKPEMEQLSAEQSAAELVERKAGGCRPASTGQSGKHVKGAGTLTEKRKGRARRCDELRANRYSACCADGLAHGARLPARRRDRRLNCLLRCGRDQFLCLLE